MRTGTKCLYRAYPNEMYALLFDDDTEEPFCLEFNKAGMNAMPLRAEVEAGREFRVVVWVGDVKGEPVKVLDLPGKYEAKW
jgi:hypothetical protein